MLTQSRITAKVNGRTYSIRQNQYGNWFGYIAGNKTEYFRGMPDQQEASARKWLADFEKTGARTQRRYITVNITMGQVYKDPLKKLIPELGGRVWSAEWDETSTQALVRATFRDMSIKEIQHALWEEWPGTSVSVEESAAAR